jgi:predicted nucleic acid-binding protein
MLYLDTSALVKLVRAERESAALTAWLQERTDVPLVSSTLAEVELARAVGAAEPTSLLRVPGVLGALELIEIDAMVRASAAALAPASLRTLDAIHLATALELTADLQALVTYDKRLGVAAAEAGLVWESPN